MIALWKLREMFDCTSWIPFCFFFGYLSEARYTICRADVVFTSVAVCIEGTTLVNLLYTLLVDLTMHGSFLRCDQPPKTPPNAAHNQILQTVHLKPHIALLLPDVLETVISHVFLELRIILAI